MARDPRVLADIDHYGCHVVHVLPTADDNHSPWAYSVGVEDSLRAPEVFVVGLKQPLAHSIVNGYCQRVRGGESFDVGSRVAGFLGGFDCEVRTVDPSN